MPRRHQIQGISRAWQWLSITRATPRMLLGFRHFFRHAYAVALDASQLEALRDRAVSSRGTLLGDLDSIDAFLAGVADEDDS